MPGSLATAPHVNAPARNRTEPPRNRASLDFQDRGVGDCLTAVACGAAPHGGRVDVLEAARSLGARGSALHLSGSKSAG